MDFFVSGTRMVLPVRQVEDGRVEYMEHNFDQRWAMFVDWMARCGDEAAREWTVKKRGPFIISSRPFYAPRGTRAMITDDHVVVCCSFALVARISTDPTLHVPVQPRLCTRYRRTLGPGLEEDRTAPSHFTQGRGTEG